MALEPSWNTVWVTGASTGIGKALAIKLSGKGCHIAVTARSKDKLDALAEVHREISAWPGDVTDARELQQTVAGIEHNHGAIELAVLSAGLWQAVDAQTINPDDFHRISDVNYMGVVNAAAAVIPGMIERRSGHIAIFSSLAGFRGLPQGAAYGPTKAALINLAETLKLELEPHGITISIINPGFIETPMTAVNKFPMPFLMSVDDAADRIIKGLRRRDYDITFPKRLGIIVKLLRCLPNGLFFWIIRKTVMRRAKTRD